MSATVLAACADHYGILVADMLGPTRRRIVASARAVASYVLKHRDDLSHHAIANILNRGDHSSAFYSVRIATERLETDPDMAGLISRLMAEPSSKPAKPDDGACDDHQIELDWLPPSVEPCRPVLTRLAIQRKPKNDLCPDDKGALDRLRGTDALLAAMQREGVMAA